MSKIQYLLVSLLFTVNLCLSNNNYFPLTIGNYWIYSNDENPNYTYYYGVFDTTVIDNKVYFIYGTSKEYPSNYFRWDSSGILYNYDPYLHYEHIWFDFTTTEGEITSIYGIDSTLLYETIVIADSISVVCPVGTFENCKYVLFDDPSVFDDEMWYWFAPNVGIVKQAGAWLPTMSLSSAQIDSQILLIKPIEPPNPNSFRLLQIFPNPFNPITNIEFTLPTSGLVTLRVYDLMGDEVKTLVDQRLNRGTHSVVWNGSNFPSGVYFVKMVNGRFTQTQKVLLLK